MISFIVFAALIACMSVSIWMSLGVRLLDFASYRRQSGTMHLLFTNLATLIGGWMFFGLSAIGYQAGVVGFVIGGAYALGLLLLSLLVPRIKRTMVEGRCDTLDDFIGLHYGPVAQSLSTILNLIFFVAILSAQFIAMSAFLKVFGSLESPYLFHVAAISVIAYTAFSGFKGVLLTDIWQFVVLTVGVIVFFGALAMNTSVQAVKALDPVLFRGTGYGFGFLAAVGIIFPITILVRTDLWQRIASARDEGVARRAFVLSAPILLAFYLALTANGMFARAMLSGTPRPDTSAFAFYLSLDWGSVPSLVRDGVTAIISLGVFAALLSTADTNLNLVAVSLSKLLRRKKWAAFEASGQAAEPKPSDLEQFLISDGRLMTVIVGLVSVALASLLPDIVNLLVSAVAAIAVFIPSVLAALLKKNRNRAAGIASLAVGLAALVPSIIWMPKIAMIVASVAATIGYFAVLPFAKSPVQPGQ